MKIKGNLTILVGERTKIWVEDVDACVRFLEIEIGPEQLAQVLGRRANVPCEIKIRIEHVGKIRETRPLDFPVPEGRFLCDRKEAAATEAHRLAPAGWTPDLSFGSQKSFSQVGGVTWAHTTVYRWVPRAEEGELEEAGHAHEPEAGADA